MRKIYKEKFAYMKMEKRGQGLSISAIILIILGILVLVFLIIGFAIGWNKIFPWIKPSNNVGDIANACGIACNTQDKYDFCNVKRKLFTAEEEYEDTCFFYSKKRPEFGVEECDIKCDVYDFSGNVLDLVKEKCKELGEELKYLDNFGTQIYACQAGDGSVP